MARHSPVPLMVIREKIWRGGGGGGEVSVLWWEMLVQSVICGGGWVALWFIH